MEPATALSDANSASAGNMVAPADAPPLSGAELDRQALAARVDPAAFDGPELGELLGGDREGARFRQRLPEWYMPAPDGPGSISGWRRNAALVVVGSILLLNAAGFCVIYGYVTLG
ncbi:MAG: hypothetical protein R2754_06670 [Microthrixaceae bacterium]